MIREIYVFKSLFFILILGVGHPDRVLNAKKAYIVYVVTSY